MTRQKNILSLLVVITFSIFAVFPRLVHAELPVGNYCNFYPISENYGNVVGDITLNNNCVVYEDINGVANGDMIVDGSSITLHKTLVWYPGKKITLLNEGKIWVNTNGRIVQSKLCVKDTNNNRYPGVISITVDPYGQGTTTTLTQLDQKVADASTLLCPAGYNYRETMLSLSYADANDSDMTKSSDLATSDHDLLSRGFWVAGVRDVNAVGNPVKLVGDNLLVCTSAPCTATFQGASDYGNLYVNNRVGIGTTIPTNKLTIVTPLTTGDDAVPTLGVNSGKFAFLNGGGNGLYGLIGGVLGTGNAFMQVQRTDGTATAYGLVLNPVGGTVGIGTTNPVTQLQVHLGSNLNASFQLHNGKPTLTTHNDNWSAWNDLGLGSSVSIKGDTGNVGIGTTTPSALLDVAGSIQGGANNFTLEGADITNPYIDVKVSTIATGNNYGHGLLIRRASDNGNWFNLGMYSDSVSYWGTLNGSGGAGSVYLNSGGSLGVGLTSPSNKLHVSGNIGATGWVGSGCEGACESGSGYNIMYENGTIVSSGQIAINASTTPSTNTNFTIGNASVDYQANAGWAGAWNANILITGQDYTSISFHDGSTSVGALTYHSNIFAFDGAGSWGPVKLGINTRVPTYNLQVTGSFYAGGSSREYKENIEKLSVDSSKIYQLEAKTYDYKKEYKDMGKILSGGRQFGFIAEEVNAIIPELTLSDGQKNVANVDYEKLGVLIIEEMKKQKAELDALKIENQQLKDQLNNIELRLQKLENN